MATDMVSSPLTFRGRILYAVGCGLLTFVIRRFGRETYERPKPHEGLSRIACIDDDLKWADGDGVRALIEVDTEAVCPRCAEGRGCGAGIFSGAGRVRRLEARIPHDLDVAVGGAVEGRLEHQVEIVGIRETIKTTVTDIEMFRKLLDEGVIGDRMHSLSLRMRMGDGWGERAYLDRQPFFR